MYERIALTVESPLSVLFPGEIPIETSLGSLESAWTKACVTAGTVDAPVMTAD